MIWFKHRNIRKDILFKNISSLSDFTLFPFYIFPFDFFQSKSILVPVSLPTDPFMIYLFIYQFHEIISQLQYIYLFLSPFFIVSLQLFQLVYPRDVDNMVTIIL